MRELYEETGISVPEECVYFVSYEDKPSANRQNVTFRFGAYDPSKTIEQLSNFSKENNEEDEVGEIAWVPIDAIGNHKWAFNHDKTILTVLEGIKNKIG